MGGTQSLIHSSSYCGIFRVDKSEYLWHVKDFKKLLAEDVGYSTCSDDLSARVNEDTETFKLVLYPNGFNKRVKGYASLWLQKLSSKERRIKFTCAVIGDKGTGKQVFIKSLTQSLGLETFLGWMAFCSRNILSSVLMDDTLILKCTLEIFGERALANPENEGSGLVESALKELSSDLLHLFSQNDYTDFTIEVQGRYLYAHKAVLSARSPVFNTMLKSKLTTSNQIKISDISEHTLKEMLNFMYSGNVGNLDFQEAIDLYYAADKYCMSGLKTICCNILKNNLEICNVLSVLLLSERHSDEGLKEVCIGYIIKHASQVQEQKQWINFLKSKPQLASIVFKRLISRQ